mmetsp:Transcript_44322/g.103441  ORF Transcript_44322/g.103441 Transcript_44322/m.103441 type:complete len:299 (-) Transcript_44322:63-959(-)
MAGEKCFHCNEEAARKLVCEEPHCEFARPRRDEEPLPICVVCEDRNCWFCPSCGQARGIRTPSVMSDVASTPEPTTPAAAAAEPATLSGGLASGIRAPSVISDVASTPAPAAEPIKAVAVAVKGFCTPYNRLLRGLEIPAWISGMLPEIVIVFWLSELYMTHFSILVQSSCGTLYRLERNPCKRKETTEKRVKFSSGGVDLREVLEPDLETLSLGAECSDGSIVCFVKEDPDIDWTKVHEYKREQEQAEYSTLFNNCQHMAYDFICKFKAAQDIPGFEVWCRRLQNQWRTFSNLPPST